MRYARKWGNACKKTTALHIMRASMDDVITWQRSIAQKVSYYTKQKYAIVTQDESNFKDAVLSRKFWAALGFRIFMPWSGSHHRFPMFCLMVSDGRCFYNYTKTVNTTSFLNHIEHVYKNTGKMLLFLDRAPWHTSKEAREFFKTRDIIVVWYPTGHPYLNPVEEVWNSLKRAVVHSIRYADIDTHCKAVESMRNGQENKFLS